MDNEEEMLKFMTILPLKHKALNCSLHSIHEIMTFQYDSVPECRCFACNDLANFSIGNQDKLSNSFI